MRVMRVMSEELQVSIKLQVTSFYINFYMKVRVGNYELNLRLQFSKTFVESNFETASC